MVSSRKKTAPSPRLPTLTRVILKKLEVQRREVLASKLSTKIIHEISLVPLMPTEKMPQVRIKGEVSLNGKWYSEGGKEPIVSFLGSYEARFIFPQDIQLDWVEKWMEDAYYRDSAIAQAIPVINLHMDSQLVMMGLNARSKKLGYESKSDWEELKQLTTKPAKRVKKKTTPILK